MSQREKYSRWELLEELTDWVQLATEKQSQPLVWDENGPNWLISLYFPPLTCNRHVLNSAHRVFMTHFHTRRTVYNYWSRNLILRIFFSFRILKPVIYPRKPNSQTFQICCKIEWQTYQIRALLCRTLWLTVEDLDDTPQFKPQTDV